LLGNGLPTAAVAVSTAAITITITITATATTIIVTTTATATTISAAAATSVATSATATAVLLGTTLFGFVYAEVATLEVGSVHFFDCFAGKIIVCERDEGKSAGAVCFTIERNE
jgi:hypothetical protein